MSKFNQKPIIGTQNRSGHIAYSMSDREHLVSAVLTTMFGEPKFYGSTDNDIVRLATVCAANDPEFLCKLACFARNENNMRSVSHVLTAVIAREAREYTRSTIRRVVVRPDDITEIMSCYASMYGKPFPNAMKREVASVIQTFDEYQLAKYNGGGKALKLRDVLKIVHPVPKDEQTAVLMGKVLSDTLETPYTWEVELSERGNNKRVWNDLIASGKVGYMALLRNLRNIVKAKAQLAPVLARLSDPEQVKRSRQLPFRFYSAYRTLLNESLMTDEIHDALEKALCASVANMELIPGNTLIAVDVSASMQSSISFKSEVRSFDIAALMGAMASRMCEKATVCYFDYAGGWSANGLRGYRIEQYDKDESILEICSKNAFTGGGTDMSLPMRYAFSNTHVSNKPFDRVIYFSDNECNRGRDTVQSLADMYRTRFNKNFWVHAVDLQGYGTQQFCGDKFNLIAGWNDNVLPFVMLAERGIGSLVDVIAAYEI